MRTKRESIRFPADGSLGTRCQAVPGLIEGLRSVFRVESDHSVMEALRGGRPKDFRVVLEACQLIESKSAGRILAKDILASIEETNGGRARRESELRIRENVVTEFRERIRELEFQGRSYEITAGLYDGRLVTRILDAVFPGTVHSRAPLRFKYLAAINLFSIDVAKAEILQSLGMVEGRLVNRLKENLVALTGLKDRPPHEIEISHRTYPGLPPLFFVHVEGLAYAGRPVIHANGELYTPTCMDRHTAGSKKFSLGSLEDEIRLVQFETDAASGSRRSV